jgi:hypothetical protein
MNDDGPTTYWTDPHQALIHQIAVNRDTFLAKQIIAERDRARDVACALEAETAQMRDAMRAVCDALRRDESFDLSVTRLKALMADWLERLLKPGEETR